MPIPARVRSLWATLIHKDRLDRELDDELRAAVETLVRRYTDEGLDPESARRAALAEFDDLHAVAENVREARFGAGLDACLVDVRYGWRCLRSAPAFAAVIVATLALGIGANTALFSVVHALLLKPLPYRDPARLVFVWLDRNQVGYPRGPMSGPDLRDLRERTRSFAELGGIWATGSVTLTGDREPEQLRSALVTTNFFDVLGVRPALGRGLVPEDVESAEPVVLLGWELFQRRFGGDPSIVGRTIQVNGDRTRVIGVLPEDCRLLLPPTASVPDRLQAFIPFWPHLEDGPRRNHFLRVVGRLAAGVTLEMARDDVAAMAGEVSRELGTGRSFTLVNLQDEGVREIRAPLAALAVGVGLLLAIACVNVAGLLIARAAGRARETALRIALGASRMRLLRQSLIEGLMLTALGVIAGIGTGAVCLRIFVAVAPASLRRLESSSIDAQVLLFTIAVSSFWGVLFSLAPVAEIFRAAGLGGSGRAAAALATASARTGGTVIRYRLRRDLIVAQVAMSMVLLVSAALLVRAFDRVLRVDPGFRADRHLTFRVAIPGRLETREAYNAFTLELQRRVAAMPGITGGGVVSHIPYDDLPNWALPYSLESPLPADAPSADSRAVTPGLLESLGVTLVEGRLFTADDRDPDRPAIVIDDMLARELWPGQSAVGRTLFVRLGTERATVIGVVKHLRLRSLIADLSPQLFVPLIVAQRNPIAFMFATSEANPASLVPAVRAAVASLDPLLPIYEARPMRDYIDDARATRRFTMLLAAAFALAALALTSVGVYGVLAYAVAHRQHELGVRRALGADTVRIAAAVVREGVGFAVAGTAIGLGGALVAGTLLETQLYGLEATDPVSFAAAGALIVAGAIVACGVPAWRAVRVSPMDALR
jgi:putative ABC transport system permease protein